MNFLVTGIAGFLGSHLGERLVKNTNHTIIGNDNLLGGYVDNIPEGVSRYKVDCCDYEGMYRILEGVDVVIHTAATAHEGLSVFSPSFITKNIYDASVTTMSAAIARGVKKFIFL